MDRQPRRGPRARRSAGPAYTRRPHRAWRGNSGGRRSVRRRCVNQWRSQPAREVLSALESIGWTVKRQSGSAPRSWQRKAGRTTSSHSMIARKLARRCWRVLPKVLVSRRMIFRSSGGRMRLKDKVAIITGAASGFGEGMAKRFAGGRCQNRRRRSERQGRRTRGRRNRRKIAIAVTPMCRCVSGRGDGPMPPRAPSAASTSWSTTPATHRNGDC